MSRSLICFLLLRSAILLTAAVGAHCMSPSDDDRYAPSSHRPTNQNTPSPECRASEMQYESRAVSLFALRSLSRPRYSQLAARGSRLEYRTRFLAAPPAGILEQKRDCSQSRGGVISILIIYVPPKIIHFPPRIDYSSYFQQHVRQ